MGISKTAALVFCLAALCIQPEPGAAAPPYASGNGTALWLLCPVEGSQTDNHVYLKKLGDKWERAVTILGTPVAIQAVNDRLLLVFENGICSFVSDDGAVRRTGKLPVEKGDIVSLCELETADAVHRTVAAVVTRRESTDSRSRPAAADTADTRIYRLYGNTWELLTEAAVGPADSLLSVAAEGEIFILKVASGERTAPAYLTRIYPDSGTIESPVSLRAGYPRALFSLNGTIVLAGSEPVSGRTDETTIRFKTAWYDPAGGRTGTINLVRLDDAVFTWRQDNQPTVTPLGRDIVFLWREEDGQLYSATGDLSGQLRNRNNITGILRRIPRKKDGAGVIYYFFIGTFILVGAILIFTPARSRQKPFILPREVRPANLPKRLLAFLIDYISISIITSLISLLFLDAKQIDGLTRWTYRYWEWMQQSLQSAGETPVPPAPLPGVLVFLWLLFMCLFVMYSGLMEYFTGATVGKKLMKLQVVADEAADPNVREIAIRNLFKLTELSALPVAWLMIIVILFPLVTQARQRFGDLWARTAVVSAASLEQFKRRRAEEGEADQPDGGPPGA